MIHQTFFMLNKGFFNMVDEEKGILCANQFQRKNIQKRVTKILFVAPGES
jgi:hypothetical protein